jgi:hypothetical protein
LFYLGDPKVESTNDVYAVTLPAGRYRLYAIGAAQVSAKLTIPQREGAASYSPTVAVPLVTQKLEQRDPVPTDDIAALGASATLKSDGLYVVEMMTSAAAALVQRVEGCEYAPGADSSGSNAFGYGCPGGSSVDSFVQPLGGGTGFGFASFVATPGTWGIGGNLQSAGAPATSDGVAAWMDYEGVPIPGATVPDPPAAPPTPVAPAPVAPAANQPAAPAPVKAKAKRRVARHRCPRAGRRASRATKRKVARCRRALQRAAKR